MSEPIIIYVDTPTTYRKRQLEIAAADAEHRCRRLGKSHDRAAINYDGNNNHFVSSYETMTEKLVQPFKRNDLQKILSYLQEHEMYRDYMFFVIGVNFGLRFSDLCRLKFGHFMNSSGVFYEEIQPIVEKKTSSTKKRKVNRHIYINASVREAVKLFLKHNTCDINDYLFTNLSPNKGRYKDKDGHYNALSNTSGVRIIKNAAYLAGVDGIYGTHSLRKTFGSMYMEMHANDPRALYNLQQIFHHSSPDITLNYIGISSQDIKSAYDMNIGLEDLTIDTLQTTAVQC